MTAYPKVSVIIPTFNRAHYLTQAIDSVLAQTYQNFEIIVVDDGSTDDTAAVLKSYKASVNYFYQENQGPSAARNLGIEMSNGQYIAFLDSDDLWLPEKLEVQRDYFKTNPEVGLVHADLLIMEDGLTPSVPRMRYLSQPRKSGYILPELFTENMILTPTVLVRRACFKVSGLFDTELRGGEDHHLWLRIARHFSIDYIDRPLGICRVHPNSLTQNTIPHYLEHLAAMEKLLQLHPEIVDEIGENVVRKGISRIVFILAYHHFDKGNYREARSCFSRLIRLRPRHWPNYGYYLAALLPHQWVHWLRQSKRIVSKQLFQPRK